MGALELRGQLARLLIFAGSTLAHPSSRCRYFLGKTLTSLSHIQFHLVIVFHMHTTLFVLRWWYARPSSLACRGEWPFCVRSGADNAPGDPLLAAPTCP